MNAEYLISLGDKQQLPKLIKGKLLDGKAEGRIIIAGRSNVGKSSLINALLKQNIAHVSKQPGKTRKINFFHALQLKKIVADLPGYGYAKRNAAEIKSWGELIQAYIEHDENLSLALLLSDSRHGPTEADLQAYGYFADAGIPTYLVFTKFDQLKTQKLRAKRLKEVKAALEEVEFDKERIIWTSSNSRKGLGEVINVIRKH